VNLLPLVLLVVFTLRKVPPFLAILGMPSSAWNDVDLKKTW
jgi:hypothetical protein